MLSEFIDPKAPVLFPTAEGVHSLSFAELLPQAFGMNLK